MKVQACEPCAKRKVRCDKGEPCSNCKRRKQDHCSYPEVSPFDRIKKLEDLVRSLGGNPLSESQYPDTPESRPSPAQQRTQPQHNEQETASFPESGKCKDPVIIEEDGQSVYLESRAWQGWLGKNHNAGDNHNIATGKPFLARSNPSVLQGLLLSKYTNDLNTKYPSRQHAIVLWDFFNERVNPLIRISFNWELQRLHSVSIDPEQRKQMTNAEHIFMFSLYVVTIVSLTNEECERDFQQPRSAMLPEYEALFEEALSRTNIFCMTDITILKAMTMYMMAGGDQVSTQSLWSLMGIVSRSAERLGIHRDGTMLNLSPHETEERRRLWWHLQHLDLGLAVRSGLTPLTLMADWDAKLPLNIEDEDMTPTTSTSPGERQGLTTMSYCLFAYWVLDQQRRFFTHETSRFELSWQSNTSIPYSSKESLIKKMEDGLNQKFLQFCDPIKPLDILVQLTARSLICGLRLRTLHPMATIDPSGQISASHRTALFDICMQCLEYNVALHSQPAIKCFHWWTKNFFPWHAFMCVLVETSHQTDQSTTRRIWKLLSELYASNSFLSLLGEDRRRGYAAGLVVKAWKANWVKWPEERRPGFVAELEARLLLLDRVEGDANQVRMDGDGEDGFTDYGSGGVNAVFDLDFQDVDWSFWNSID